MLTKTQDKELVGQFATDRPNKRAVQPARRLPGDAPSLAMIAILVLFAVIGYIISRSVLLFWIWLSLPLIGIAKNGVLFMQRRKASAFQDGPVLYYDPACAFVGIWKAQVAQ